MKVICFDLDDTLYKEINYLHAAYKLIAQKEFGNEWENYYHLMLLWYEEKKDVFSRMVDLVPQMEKGVLLNMYRYDVHNLYLPIEIDEVLAALKVSGIRLGLITDGRSITQRNKIKALDLDKYFDEDMIIISEEFGCEKPALANYEYFMKKFPECKNFIYVGDNPEKDFVGANVLGWNTVCLLDDGRNIHKQEFVKYSEEFLPKQKINTLKELL